MSETWKFYRTKIHNLTDEQKAQLTSICHTFRFCYNWAINLYSEKLKDGVKLTLFDLTDAFTEFRNNPENEWIKEYDMNTCRYAISNAYDAFQNYFSKRSNYPKFKTKKSGKLSFQVRGDRLTFFGKDNRYVRIPGCGRSKKVNVFDCKKHRISVDKDITYYNTTIKYDGLDFWLSTSIVEKSDNKDQSSEIVDNDNDSIVGIDVGIRTTAYLSNGVKFDAPDKHRLNVLENRRRKLQSSILKQEKKTRRMGMKAKCEPESMRSKNQEKRLNKLKKTYISISNIYKSHYHNVSKKIADMRFNTVVLEDLRINKIEHSEPYMRKFIKPARLSILLDYISYKCNNTGSKVIKAPMTFPSSQICSNCGFRRSSFTQKEFSCPICGYRSDRDYNAALNLRNYGIGLLESSV